MVSTFSEKLASKAKDVLSEQRQVQIAKKEYLINNKSEILQAAEVGYRFSLIAGLATEELFAAGTPSSYVATTKTGEEVIRESLFTVEEIKAFCSADTE
jgi:hypothetical protein